MNKIQIKSVFGDVIFEHQKEGNNTAITVMEAVKKGADLSRANLSGADLSRANLSMANLSWANLKEANLSWADISGADISGANLDKKIYSINRIGSANRITTYNATDNIIYCGCFTGTIENFETKVKETHANNEVHLHNYLCAINYFKSLK